MYIRDIDKTKIIKVEGLLSLDSREAAKRVADNMKKE